MRSNFLALTTTHHHTHSQRLVHIFRSLRCTCQAYLNLAERIGSKIKVVPSHGHRPKPLAGESTIKPWILKVVKDLLLFTDEDSNPYYQLVYFQMLTDLRPFKADFQKSVRYITYHREARFEARSKTIPTFQSLPLRTMENLPTTYGILIRRRLD